MHEAARVAVARMLESLPPPRSAVEIGGRDVNGSVADLLPPGCARTGIDVLPGPGVDVVADAAAWRPPEPVDLVICAEVLEHARDPAALVCAAAEMLAPGGALVLTCAVRPRREHSGVDGGPLRHGEPYRALWPGEVAGWLAASFPLLELRTDPARGDLYALARTRPGPPAARAAAPGRILLVHPGASTSTSDIYDGLAPALAALGAEVVPYRLDLRLADNAAWLDWRWRRAMRAWAANGAAAADRPARPDPGTVMYCAGRDVLESALRHGASWVLGIGGLLWSPLAMDLARAAGLRLALILTESPYVDEAEATMLSRVDVAWTNERSSVDGPLGRVNPWLRYLPHAAPAPVTEGSEAARACAEARARVAAHDVVFVGTAWDERIALLSAVDWEGLGIDLGLYGNWRTLLGSRSRLRRFVRGDQTTPAETAALYARCRVGLNLYRWRTGIRSDGPEVEGAESANPRAYALAAAGVPFVSEYRAESAELFGAHAPHFGKGDATALGRSLRALLSESAEDRAARSAGLIAAAAPHTFADRAARVLGDLAAFERAVR